MENPNLAELQEILTSNTEEATSIRNDLDTARELLASCDARLIKLLGAPAPRQQKPLKHYIKQALDNSNEPLTVKEIAELVLESGYKTNSENFHGVVFQALKSDAAFKRKTRPKTKPARFSYEGV